MDKRIGLIVLVVVGVLVVGSCYGFLGVKADKTSVADKKASGISFPDMMTQLSRNMALWSRFRGYQGNRKYERCQVGINKQGN